MKNPHDLSDFDDEVSHAVVVEKDAKKQKRILRNLKEEYPEVYEVLTYFKVIPELTK